MAVIRKKYTLNFPRPYILKGILSSIHLHSFPVILPPIHPFSRLPAVRRISMILLTVMLLPFNTAANAQQPAIGPASIVGSEVNNFLKREKARELTDRPPSSILAAACQSGECRIAASVLAAGADPNSAATLLTIAAERNDSDLTELLISYGADASLSPAALPAALKHQNARIASLLLNAGADPNLPDSSGTTPLRAALLSGNLDIARLMIRHGGSPDEFLEPSIAAGDLALLGALFQYGLSPDQTDAAGNPLVVRAVTDNKPDVVRFLIENGADPKKPGREGLTALHLAAVAKNETLLRTLLDGGADPNQPFLHPVRPEILTLLEGESFKKWLQRDTGLTPLMLAASRGDTAMIKLLMEKGARRGQQSRSWKRYPVVFACDGEHVPAARLLLGRNPAPDEPEYRVTITLSTQRAVLYKDDEAIRSCRVSTGRKGYATPTGKFVITDKSRDWISTIYHVSMPFFMRLNCREIGMHAGVCPGYPASHGCIRIPRADVQVLFSLLKIGDAVTIED